MVSAPNHNAMQLRVVRPDEGALAANVIETVLGELGLAPDPESSKELKNLPSSIRSTGGEVWLVEIDGATVAAMAVAKTSDGWEIKWFAVMAKWQGMGIGRMLAENAVQHIRENQATKISVTLYPGMERAYELLRSLRFQPVNATSFEEATGEYVMQRRFA